MLPMRYAIFDFTYEILDCVDCLPHLRTEQFLLQALCELDDGVLDLLLQLVPPLRHLLPQLLLGLLCCLFCILDVVCYL